METTAMNVELKPEIGWTHPTDPVAEVQQFATPAAQRRYDIDWLRVILFALLIWFHYAVFSLWQIEGDDSSMELFNLPLFIIIGVMHQWRLAALFIISGMGTAFAFRRRSWKTYIKERGARLGLPLLFGTYILFFGIFEPIDATRRLFTPFPGSQHMPYGHLWFIYNLLIYSILLTPLFTYVKNNPNGKLIQFVRSVLKIRYGMGLLLLPPIVLFVNGLLFKPWAFGEVGMWWEFPRYLLYFFFGFLMISAKEDYFPAIDRIRIPITIIAPIFAIAWYTVNESSSIPHVMDGGWVEEGYSTFSYEATVATFIQSFHAWFWCLFIFSWASKILNRPSKWLAYLNEAVYPTYIVHMHLTFLPIAIFGIAGLGYYVGLTFGTILVMIGVMVCFEIARRATYARAIFGIKGGHEEVSKLFPYNMTEERSTKIILAIVAHMLVIGMIIGLMVALIGAGILTGG
ncbi:MAG: acyltransferase family protein [Candidatus Thalassarchaeaceae archaeon]|nr:acyltransferase family protein [Candidatus Thalassarchaeaceae archaeon]